MTYLQLLRQLCRDNINYIETIHRIHFTNTYTNLKAWDLSYFSKMAWKVFAGKTIKIISEEIIMRYVQL
jgi:hypothetical protein